MTYRRTLRMGILLGLLSLVSFGSYWQWAYAQPAAGAVDLSTAVMHVAKQAIPAVVHIEVTERHEVAEPQRSSEENPLLHRFFNAPHPSQKFRREVTGLGSGVLMDAQGHILTNNHVADGASTIEVLLANGQQYPARVIGVDAKTDLAVLKIDAKAPLPFVTFGDSDTVEVGEWVVAIGHPRGLDQTVTHGIVSAKHRRGITDPSSYQDFLQTDAAINPGNSGGPLLNLRGEVIGINTAIASQSGGSEGIGFAIPSTMAAHVAQALIAHGKVERAWLGASVQDVSPGLAQAMGLEAPRGALIAHVVQGGPAEQAGLKQGDVVLTYNDKDMADAGAFRNAVATTPVGQDVRVTMLRHGHSQAATVTVRNLEEWTQALRSAMQGRLGVDVRPVTVEEAEKYDLESQQGVTITGVQSRGILGQAGLEVDDIILAIDGQPVEGVESLAELVTAFQPQQRIAVLALDHRSGDTGHVQVVLR